MSRPASTSYGGHRTPVPTLPAPFDDIRFKWDVSDQFIKLEYLGLAERLIECGAIEPRMAEKAAKGAPKPRTDSAGHRFYREPKIMRQPLAQGLLVIRSIADPIFAESLPGAPRGLRWKRLDFLDAHPGCVHFREVRVGSAITVFSAGTVESLLAAGYPEQAFCVKRDFWAKRSARSLYGENDGLPPGTHADIRRLMRGYFEIETRSSIEAVRKPTSKLTAMDERPPLGLRLVVDNSRPGVQP